MDWSGLVTSMLRGMHVAALLSLFGCLVFRRFVIPAGAAREGVPWTIATRIGTVSAWITLGVGVIWLFAVSGSIAGAASLGAVFDAVPKVALHTDFGQFACVRLGLLACIPALLRSTRPWARLAALLLSGAAVAPQPWLGHIGALPVGTRVVLAQVEIAHLLAAGAWLGGLAPLFFSLRRTPVPVGVLLCERFTPVGLVGVGTIAVTALPQAGELIGGLPGLFGTQYGHLALLKLGLFALALGLACANRFVLTARLKTARGWLMGSIAIEAVLGLCVVLAAAALASSAPAAHVQPVWPFAWRPSTEAWYDPASRPGLLRLAIAFAAGLALIAASLIWRRFRVLAALAAAGLIGSFAPSLGLLLVPAYPTSYARSTTGFAADSILRGQGLYGQNCAVCHDAMVGSGGSGDLLAPHIWGHLDGELFWWTTDGVADRNGSALMPGFASLLSEDDRWALIDFIKARNAGAHFRDTGKWAAPIPAPGMSVICDGSDVEELADLRGRILLIVAGEIARWLPETEGEPGLTVIRLIQNASTRPARGACIAAETKGWDAWAVIAGVPADRFAGFVTVVDGHGWVRASLPPDTDMDRLRAAIVDARDHPIGLVAVPAGVHQH